MISPGCFIEPTDNPYRMKEQSPPVTETFFKNASREFLIALAAGVEMETNCEVKPDGRYVMTVTTVPLVAIADLGDGRIKVFTRTNPNAQNRKMRESRWPE